MTWTVGFRLPSLPMLSDEESNAESELLEALMKKLCCELNETVLAAWARILHEAGETGQVEDRQMVICISLDGVQVYSDPSSPTLRLLLSKDTHKGRGTYVQAMSLEEFYGTVSDPVQSKDYALQHMKKFARYLQDQGGVLQFVDYSIIQECGLQRALLCQLIRDRFRPLELEGPDPYPVDSNEAYLIWCIHQQTYRHGVWPHSLDERLTWKTSIDACMQAGKDGKVALMAWTQGASGHDWEVPEALDRALGQPRASDAGERVHPAMRGHFFVTVFDSTEECNEWRREHRPSNIHEVKVEPPSARTMPAEQRPDSSPGPRVQHASEEVDEPTISEAVDSATATVTATGTATVTATTTTTATDGADGDDQRSVVRDEPSDKAAIEAKVGARPKLKFKRPKPRSPLRGGEAAASDTDAPLLIPGNWVQCAMKAARGPPSDHASDSEGGETESEAGRMPALCTAPTPPDSEDELPTRQSPKGVMFSEDELKSALVTLCTSNMAEIGDRSGFEKLDRHFFASQTLFTVRCGDGTQDSCPVVLLPDFDPLHDYNADGVPILGRKSLTKMVGARTDELKKGGPADKLKLRRQEALKRLCGAAHCALGPHDRNSTECAIQKTCQAVVDWGSYLEQRLIAAMEVMINVKNASESGVDPHVFYCKTVEVTSIILTKHVRRTPPQQEGAFHELLGRYKQVVEPTGEVDAVVGKLDKFNAHVLTAAHSSVASFVAVKRCADGQGWVFHKPEANELDELAAVSRLLTSLGKVRNGGTGATDTPPPPPPLPPPPPALASKARGDGAGTSRRGRAVDKAGADSEACGRLRAKLAARKGIFSQTYDEDGNKYTTRKLTKEEAQAYQSKIDSGELDEQEALKLVYERAEIRAMLENPKTSKQEAAAAGNRMLQLDKRLDILDLMNSGTATATPPSPPSPQSPQSPQSLPSPGKGEGKEPADARVHQESAVGEPESAIDEFLSLSKKDKKAVIHLAHQDEKRERERKKREQRKMKKAVQQAKHVLAARKDEEKVKIGKEQEKREAARRAFEEKQRKRAAEAAALAAKEAERERLFADLRRDANGNFLPTEQFTNKLLLAEGESCKDQLIDCTCQARVGPFGFAFLFPCSLGR